MDTNRPDAHTATPSPSFARALLAGLAFSAIIWSAIALAACRLT